MAEIVYVLCLLTSLFCAVLLFRSYLAGRSRLVFWSMLCFIGLAINNALLVVDLVVLADVADLRVARAAFGFLSPLVLLGALVWEQR